MSLARFFPPPSIILPALWVGLLCASPAAAQQQPQQTCTLKVENSPELRGFRLGMSLDEVKTGVPKARMLGGRFGQERVELHPQALREADPEKFRGVEAIFLDLLDGRVVSISAVYDGSVNWKSVEQFASAVAKALNLPPAWDDNNPGSMACDGFQIFVNANHISMRIPGAYDIVRRREVEEENKKRQSFRP